VKLKRCAQADRKRRSKDTSINSSPLAALLGWEQRTGDHTAVGNESGLCVVRFRILGIFDAVASWTVNSKTYL